MSNENHIENNYLRELEGKNSAVNVYHQRDKE